MNGLNTESAEFEDAKLWSHSFDSEEWTHLQKSTQNVSQLLEKVEENVLKSFDEMEKRISGIGKFFVCQFSVKDIVRSTTPIRRRANFTK